MATVSRRAGMIIAGRKTDAMIAHASSAMISSAMIRPDQSSPVPINRDRTISVQNSREMINRVVKTISAVTTNAVMTARANRARRRHRALTLRALNNRVRNSRALNNPVPNSRGLRLLRP